jgi:hypothetical protein
MATNRTNPAYRRQEQIADTNHRRSTRQTNPAYRRQEQISDTNQRRLAREQPFFITWQLSLILQVAHTYIISLAGYGMRNVAMGVGTYIC